MYIYIYIYVITNNTVRLIIMINDNYTPKRKQREIITGALETESRPTVVAKRRQATDAWGAMAEGFLQILTRFIRGFD